MNQTDSTSSDNELDKTSLEKRSLEIGKWANLLMAISGVVAAYLSRSDSLLVDGLYSGVNFISAIIAAKITASITLPANRKYPFGYDAYEALYVKYRSMVLLGILVFAIFGAISKIITYLGGGQVPELVFGPILIYMILMIVICFGLSYWHRCNWKLAGESSEILKTESKAAVIDGVISAGAGCGLLAAAFLKGTFLESLVPISDSIIVLIMCSLIIRDPITMFLKSLREVAGEATDPETINQITELTNEILDHSSFEVLEVAASKLGRVYFIVPYLKPKVSLSATQVDEVRHELLEHYSQHLGEVRAEVVITAEHPFR